MIESTHDGNPLLAWGGASHFRFRDLLHRLFSMANQGFLRLEFLQMASGSILEFLACDILEVRLEDGGKVYRCRAEVGEGGFRFLCDLVPSDPDPSLLADQIMASVLKGQFLAASPFSTRGGSFWTSDSTRPVLLRESGRLDAQAHSVVIGGEYRSLAFVPVPVDERIRGVLYLGSRKADYFTRNDVQYFEGVGETLGVAVAFQAAQWALRERVKELDCLYGIAQVSQLDGRTLEEQLQDIVELLPPAWQYPELTSARILFNGRMFDTPGFQETPWLQEADILVAGKLRGAVQVYYVRDMPAFDEGPFLQEERNLIEEVAHQVGLLVNRGEDALAKAKLFHMLEQRRE
ncbi:GAF domain-containing protein [Geothrix sp. 21YS21S-2]|uniref:GAF domain-containing protein n=1 Tax=Geothrix sp. 21YS21S-2 TaxID=3068893 RepID=UPI0027BA6B14|nr:GAF domain-containing protein [Geothrix sp. 21YS21S-2]